MKFKLLFVVLLTCALLHHGNSPSAFAQLTRLKTSYSALTANMAVVGANLNATLGTPAGNNWANTGKTNWNTAFPGNSAMSPQAVGNVGGSQPHTNMMPYLVLNFCIALQGIFPSQT